MRVALLTYSTKPRGGVVHTLALAEALAAQGASVQVWTLGRGGDTGFYRPVDPGVALRVVPFPDVEGERVSYASGDRFAAFDTPVGRLGMLIDYDKTFPEAARALALDGAQVLACLSAWPASTTDPARRVVKDRQARLFDLYDCARAAENQLVLASANQTGSRGRLRFLGQAKVVGPGGEVRARTWSKAGLAVADLDVPGALARARRVLHHLAERRPQAYRS